MVKLPGNPSKKRMALLVVGGGFTLIVVVFLLVYFVVFPTSSPKPFKLATSTATSTGNTSSASTSTVSTGGRWSVSTGSEAGYRVREKLGFLPAESDAVGRTSSITGAAVLTESKGTITITTASFDVAVNTQSAGEKKGNGPDSGPGDPRGGRDRQSDHGIRPAPAAGIGGPMPDSPTTHCVPGDPVGLPCRSASRRSPVRGGRLHCDRRAG